ncbi:MAG TPA: hypothetical protein VFZ83_05105, partial [Acidimicrobiia bacterium]|nr:hypothetical protein [Acidimicrobiia bacterium]
DDADDDPLSLQWSITHVSDPGTTCTLTDDTTLTPTINCDDDAVVTATLAIDDGINPPVEIEAELTIGNVAPTAGPITTSPIVMEIGTPLTAGINFADVGTNDTHTVDIDWEDGNVTSATVTETNGSGSASGSHTYADVGLYWISITVTDDDTGAVTVLHDFYVVVYDPDAGHVRSTAHFDSPSGAHTPEDTGDPDITGDASLGLQVQYDIGDTIPSGHADFRFNTGNIDMDSTGFAWLVVTDVGTKAIFRGTGEVNNVGGYEFVVSVIDGPTDYVRIKVWQTSSGTVIYDTQFGDADDADAITPTTNGQVVIDV